jgi:hypothetical protein
MKKIFRILLIIMLIITCLLIRITYSSYKQTTEGIFNSKIGRWSIKVNNTLITENQIETIELSGANLRVVENAYIKNDRIAPGGKVYYGLEIDPDDTDVSIKITLSVNRTSDVLEGYNFELNEIEIELTKDGQTPISVDCEQEDGTYDFIIPVDKIKNGWNCLAKVYITWKNDEDSNDEDTLLGSIKDSEIAIPIDILAEQYVGAQDNENS